MSDQASYNQTSLPPSLPVQEQEAFSQQLPGHQGLPNQQLPEPLQPEHQELQERYDRSIKACIIAVLLVILIVAGGITALLVAEPKVIFAQTAGSQTASNSSTSDNSSSDQTETTDADSGTGTGTGEYGYVVIFLPPESSSNTIAYVYAETTGYTDFIYGSNRESEIAEYKKNSTKFTTYYLPEEEKYGFVVVGEDKITVFEVSASGTLGGNVENTPEKIQEYEEKGYLILYAQEIIDGNANAHS